MLKDLNLFRQTYGFRTRPDALAAIDGSEDYPHIKGEVSFYQKPYRIGSCMDFPYGSFLIFPFLQ